MSFDFAQEEVTTFFYMRDCEKWKTEDFIS